MTLSTPTAPQFPSFDPPIHSRSPSRSPRKAQFAIKELDPLLGNLSPDSTLKALQATETIPSGATQDALSTSISDATPAEREVGIRAAFAAKKLREWKVEVLQWRWPGKQERGFGLGFIPPTNAGETVTKYRGFLTVALTEEYEARLEEIRDDLDSLGIDEIKDHVLEAHLPATGPSKTPKPIGIRTSYGRMRDFTALITATVIQALPDLAELNMLLDTWDMRLRVLKGIPNFLEVMESAQSGIREAFKELRDPDSEQNMTEMSFDGKKLALGGQVADMGRRVDQFLDILEGYEDSLPQAWIDRLEKIELEYATWVVEAQHVVLENDLAVKARQSSKADETALDLISSNQTQKDVPHEADEQPEHFEPLLVPNGTLQEAKPDYSTADKDKPHAKPKPPLTLDLSDRSGHKREISKVSMADSTYSAFSDISNAEIMDAKTTSVLPSPKVSVVNNPFRTSRDELTWFGTTSAAQQQRASKPPMLQRASTASIEVFPKDRLKQVVLRRAASWDMLSQMAQTPESTPSKALEQLTGAHSPTIKPPISELENQEDMLPSSAQSTDTTPLATPSLQVEPLQVRSREHSDLSTLPALPRRSSKRKTMDDFSSFSSLTQAASVSLGFNDTSLDQESPSRPATAIIEPSPKPLKTGESLDDKIQGILTSLPNKIRLAKAANPSYASTSTQASSTSSTRSSTPTPALTLSPAKSEPTSRKGGLGDSESKVYHLTRTGQPRDAPPVKLSVRTVGDEGRVMVRVGGGWADLGEYLREYSLHHGSRAITDGRLEVASFPGNQQKDSATVTSVSATSKSQGRRKSSSPSAYRTAFEAPSEQTRPKTGPQLQRGRSPKDVGAWTPPPVPPIPSSFTTRSPTISTATIADAGTITSVVDPDAGVPTRDPATPTNARTSTIISPGVTTTTVVTPPITATNYTPLGAAGPKMNTRRAATYGVPSSANNDAWVEGMVGKARAVSGGSPTIVQGPTTTTTTTTVTQTTPSSRRTSYFGSSPNNAKSSPVTISTSPSTGSVASDSRSRRESFTARPKSRMSLGDIGGIKRVFLRKKSENIK